MSNKKKNLAQHQRVTQKKQAQQLRSVLTGVAAVLVIGIVVAIVVSSKGAAAPAVAPERQKLEAVRGNPQAPVTIVEYGAYSCPSCRAWHNQHIIDQILIDYKDKVRFIFRDFPVITPTYDRMAAGVAQCALDQGQDRFWALHNALYEQYPDYSLDGVLNLAGQIGLDQAKLRTCAEANTYASLVQASEDQAVHLGFQGTPSFIVNDQPVFNASPQTLKTAIERALHN